MNLFDETDAVVAIGKVVFLEIPDEHYSRCTNCPLLSSTIFKKSYACKLRPSMGLSFDDDGPFKSISCPRRKNE